MIAQIVYNLLEFLVFFLVEALETKTSEATEQELDKQILQMGHW